MKPAEDHETTVVAVEAGCTTCHGTEPHWTAPNAMAVAARHAKLHHHPTWARQTIEVRYGGRAAPQETHLPGMEPIPTLGTASAAP